MNVLLIVIDTLRADHLGCYGYHRDTSPNIDGVARRAALFENAFTPAIPTHPAFATINTGQYSITHGVVAHMSGRSISRAAPWLPKLMQRAGYVTCAVDNLAEWAEGFRRGYEFYIDPSQRAVLEINCDNRTINQRAVPWLEQHAQQPFFLFVHYWDPHTPYMPPRAYRTLFYSGNPCDPENHSMDALARHPLGRVWKETWFNKLGPNVTDPAYIEALYDAEIRYCDEGVGALIQTLDALGIAGNTLAVVTGDHGELMFRHGIFFDHHGLYDGNIHVPLIVRLPDHGRDRAPRRIHQLVTQADIAPTILDLCGVPVPDTMEGVSLAPMLDGPVDRPIHPFVISQECTWQMKWAIRTSKYKLILARQPDFYGTPMRELYDLRADPHEHNNVTEKLPGIARDLEAKLEAWIAEKMAQNRLAQDPLIAQGLTLGKQWQQPDTAGERQCG